ncbi:MAG: amidohydrolase family protein [Burkholderiaceae bacterium]|nr:amidohydrolase family protein [Burkholderiaceae bacterium]
MGGSPAVDAIAVAALAAAPGRRLPLLPGGQLRQQVVDHLVVTQGGRRQALQRVVHIGLGFEPNYLWATDGDGPGAVRLFAQLWPGWTSLVEEGWESVLPQLEARQKAAADALMRQRAAAWLQPLPGLTVVRNARVFDSEAARLGPASDVHVIRGRITAVLPAGTPGGAAPDTEIDAAGRVMLPGLFDMHDHVWRGNGGLHLAAGVTTTRDLSNDNRTLQETMAQIAAGQLAYPQVVPAGFIEGNSPFAQRSGIVVRTLDEARAAVDWYAARGYPQIKVYNSFPREILRETVAYAHQRGLRVSGHVPAFLRAEEVIEMGFDEIQHVNQLLLNFLVTPTTDTRTLERFHLPAERLGALELDSAPVQDFIALLKRRGTVVDLTLMTFQFLQQRDGELPGEFAGRLYRAGVPMVAGTDSLPGIVLHSELIGYVRAGLTPAQAIQIATRNGARYTGTEADRGVIGPGRRADLILVDGEPTQNIADIRRVAGVITQGRWLAPREVHQAIGLLPFVDATPVVRRGTSR